MRRQEVGGKAAEEGTADKCNKAMWWCRNVALRGFQGVQGCIMVVDSQMLDVGHGAVRQPPAVRRVHHRVGVVGGATTQVQLARQAVELVGRSGAAYAVHPAGAEVHRIVTHGDGVQAAAQAMPRLEDNDVEAGAAQRSGASEAGYARAEDNYVCGDFRSRVNGRRTP